MLDLTALCAVRAFGRGDQQAKHERRNRADEAGAQPHNVLGIVGEMMARQGLSQQRPGQRSTKDDHEPNHGQRNRVQHFLLP